VRQNSACALKFLCWQSSRLKSLLAALAVWGGLSFSVPVSSPALAEEPAEFFRGKTVTIFVAVGPGAYDLYARVLAQHMAQHIPGQPNVIVNNMPGGGGIVAANYIANIAPKNGTALLVPLKLLAMTQMLEPANVKYDAAQFNWIGSMVDAPGVIMVWNNAPGTTMADAQRTELMLGSTGAGAETMIFPTVINTVLGTKFKIISGFKGMGDIFLAIERGEIHGVSTVYGSIAGLKPDWLADKKLRFITQVTMQRTKELPDTPSVVELGRTADERATLEFLTLSNSLGRAITAPAGVPEDRVAALRKAFDTTVNSKAYIDDAKSKGMEINPIQGAVIQRDVKRHIETPAALVARVKAALVAAGGGKPGGK